MKKLFPLLLSLLFLSSCAAPNTSDPLYGEQYDYDYYAISMNTSFPIADTLPEGEGERARVIFLLGQSNATGCSLTSYLKDSVSEEKYQEFERGYENVLIHYSLDNQKYNSDGTFVPVDLACAAGEGYFGPEVGMAEVLSEAFSDETVFLIKFTMSGYSLNHHWLYGYERASIYNAFLIYAETCLSYLSEKGYTPTVDAICWMQGESDTTDYKASRYLENTKRFVSYLREDFAPYQNERGIYFIDAGISSSPYCEPAYPEINEAKKAFASLSPLNVYFPTIEAGLTTLYEPTGSPDLGHYNAWCELELGRLFGKALVEALK